MLTIANAGIVLLFFMIAGIFCAAMAVIIIIILIVRGIASLSERSAEKRRLEELSAEIGLKPEEVVAISEWFNDRIANRKYKIREISDEKRGLNYVLQIVNDSGFEFKEFTCIVTPCSGGNEYDPVTCTVNDWRDRTVGMFRFYCPERFVDRISKSDIEIEYIPRTGPEPEPESPREHNLYDLQNKAGGQTCRSLYNSSGRE